jgi:hypothetical protein
LPKRKLVCIKANGLIQIKGGTLSPPSLYFCFFNAVIRAARAVNNAAVANSHSGCIILNNFKVLKNYPNQSLGKLVVSVVSCFPENPNTNFLLVNLCKYKTTGRKKYFSLLFILNGQNEIKQEGTKRTNRDI